mmetsp:Transcript_33942/g.87147  ORF Transcript_33942/g.87147 Transcript_33942/m.87147 type:complete len:81 (-) Transcript_33942:1002-1244(-)
MNILPPPDAWRAADMVTLLHLQLCRVKSVATMPPTTPVPTPTTPLRYSRNVMRDVISLNDDEGKYIRGVHTYDDLHDSPS